MKFTRIFTNLLFAFVVLSLTPLSALADKVNWKPIDPKDLARKTPTVEKDADAEALFWEVRIQPEGEGAALLPYIRIKIFSEPIDLCLLRRGEITRRRINDARANE